MNVQTKKSSPATRVVDVCLVAYFVFNMVFITGMFNPVQLVYDSPRIEAYQIWPPSFVVRLANWWSESFDPTMANRPVWRRTMVWIDLLLFGPFYVVAIYAFLEKKSWIRAPALLYAGVMLTSVSIIVAESFYGEAPAPFPFILLAAYATWIVFPVILIMRMWRPEPFSAESDRTDDPL